MEDRTTPITVSLPIYLDIALPALAFAIPFFVSGPQWLTGTAVNTLLYLVALTNRPQRVWIGVSLLPSLAAFSHGLVFGPATFFLIYFLPVIWVGNYIMMKTFSGCPARFNNPARLLLSAAAKAGLLFISALFYYQLKLVPPAFLTAMGIIQLATAIAGGILAFQVTTATNHHE
ncbi:hypothetical protein M1523_02815 [Patescibacteria group bacterium]|nr:hypothetical protein [Patescibacteria group bacterium]MCL5091347.1 hypothetical protein [Patescibacteria group bacterium]